ncbi:MAG: peptidase M19 [Halieaceae bacterium]|nr:peptidase M19 [Halieaceae bacterium]
MTWLKGLLTAVSLLAGALVAAFFLLGPQWVDRNANQVSGDPGRAPTPETRALHAQLIVGDLHADSALWGKDLLHRNEWGQVDLPRLIEGGATLQMFTTVTKSPRGQNYEQNATDTADNITLLAMAQRWPPATFNSLFARAMLQADRVRKAATQSPQLSLITSQSELSQLLARRARGEGVVGALLGTEGSHALDGQLDNIDQLYDAGFRMMGLQHFFDNRLGGSLHGESQAGLTPFGEQAVRNMQKKGIMIDVAHSSEATVRDTLLVTEGDALIVSHTGFDGHCPSPRNISDETMALITEAGGLIGVGFWADVTCGGGIDAIANAIQYGVERFGVDHIALGSDWDGSVTTPIDASQLPHLTQALLDAGLTQTEVRAVMGGNMARFLAQHLPPG